MMTKRKDRQHGVLKAALLTGSLVATLAGTYILGLQEPPEALATAPSVQPQELIVPVDRFPAVELPPSNRATQLQLRPIPQAVQPRIRPLARSRSSR